MSYTPIIPQGGLIGWMYLQRTADQQKELLSESVVTKRVTDEFNARIGDIRTAEALVNDRNLLTVALGAFGLQDDINNKAFIQKILETDPNDDKGLANRLADKRYKEFNEAFGFGNVVGPRTNLSGFASEIIEKFEVQNFEVKVGEVNEDMRLTLSLNRELEELANDDMSNNAKWYTILGQPPLKKAFETAFGLPTSFGTLDIDRQFQIFQEKSRQLFKTDDVSAFADPEKREELTRTFLLRAQINDFNVSSQASVALTLLQSAQRPSLF